MLSNNDDPMKPSFVMISVLEMRLPQEILRTDGSLVVSVIDSGVSLTLFLPAIYQE